MTQTPEEEITLSSSEFDQFKEESGPTSVTDELSQEIPIKEQLKLFRIFDKKYLNVNEKSAKSVTSFFVKLAILDSVPKRKRIIKFVPLLLGLVSVSLSWFIFYLKQSGVPLFQGLYISTAVVLCAAIGAILVVYVIKESRHVLIFYSQNGRIPIAEILIKKPNKQAFNKFVSELISCINAVKARSHYSQTQALAAELSDHRKLRDDGAISSKDYELAKSNIMSHH